MASSQSGKHGDKGEPKKGQAGSQGTSPPEQDSAKGQCGVGEDVTGRGRAERATLRETAINPLKNCQIQTCEPPLTGLQDLSDNSLY